MDYYLQIMFHGVPEVGSDPPPRDRHGINYGANKSMTWPNDQGDFWT